MTYKGHVEKGTVVLDEAADLPDGVLVTIEIAAVSPSGQNTLAERYRSFIGALDEQPEDWSEEHDTYLRAHYRS